MLRLAIEFAPDRWIELTEPARRAEVRRISASTLGEAQRITATAKQQVFLDVRAHLAETIPQAFVEYRQRRPGWRAGALTGEIVHPGTGRSLAGLIWDIWAAGVADGVTLRSDSPETLASQVLASVVPELQARGVRFASLEVAVA